MTLRVKERNFSRVGGLRDHIQTLKEMIIYPLMYKELFEAHGIEAPRGVLFHGPPGTGKTLMAGAVAEECSKSTKRRVAFYTRKGADCLNKYVGESEKHLQNLFTQAQSTRPSIIFFDEIDGLVPTRSESQEQVHASVVSTLLALMDGLDSKSEVFVIGATNRIDMIDPALRRPGRFDRELYFPLPPLESRLQIFHVHTENWKSKPSADFLLKLATECSGYCGADIQSLCSQAVMESFRRNYPQLSNTNKRIQINIKNIQVTEQDFWVAKEKLLPASQRISAPCSRPLTPEMEPLLKRSLDNCLEFIFKVCPFKFIHWSRPEMAKNKAITCPRVILSKSKDQGHIPHLASAVLHNFDHLPVTIVDLSTINDQSVRGSDSSSLVQKIKQARQTMPGIIYFPDIGSWWELIDETGRMVLISSLEKLDTSTTTQLFLLATSNSVEYNDLPADIRKIFPNNKVFHVMGTIPEERYNFFSELINKVGVEHGVNTNKDMKTESKLAEWKNKTSWRKSRRQEGLDAEFIGLEYERKPRLRSYYRKHEDDKSKVLESSNQKTGNKRKLQDDLWEHEPHSKRLKMENKEEESTLSFRGFKSNEITQAKLNELARLCVRVTLNSFTESVIKLYEQLEIILLRHSNSSDRSQLIQELEREITSFNPI